MGNATEEKGKQALISIIIPAYNVAPYLDECLESVCGQSYERLELLLVDDGSTDDTSKMCDAWAQRDSRIRVLHKKNGGLSDARNAALSMATGDYIGFVDPDDRISPRMYQLLYELCQSYRVPVSCIRFDAFGVSAGQENTLPPETAEIVKLSAEEYLSNIITYNEARPSSYSVCTRLYRRDILEGLLFSVGKNYEDIVFSTKALLRAGEMVYHNAYYYHYRVREDSISHKKEELRRRLITDRMDQRAEQIRYLQEIGEDQLQRIARAVYYPELRELAAQNTDPEYEEVLRETLRAWRMDWREIRQLPYGLLKKLKLAYRHRA